MIRNSKNEKGAHRVFFFQLLLIINMVYLSAYFCFGKQDVENCIFEILKAGGPFKIKTYFLMPHGIFMYQ